MDQKNHQRILLFPDECFPDLIAFVIPFILLSVSDLIAFVIPFILLSASVIPKSITDEIFYCFLLKILNPVFKTNFRESFLIYEELYVL